VGSNHGAPQGLGFFKAGDPGVLVAQRRLVPDELEYAQWSLP